MKYIEYGNKTKPVVILIHGMGCSGTKSFKSTINLIKDKYRIILPLLDGHCNDKSTFNSIEEESNKIKHFLLENKINQINTIVGMSMGGFITLDLVYRLNVKTSKIILDSGYMKNLLFPSLLSIIISNGYEKIMNNNSNIIINSGMKIMMGYCTTRKDLNSYTNKESIKNCEYSCLTYKLPNIYEMNNMKVIYLYGNKEPYMIKGMKLLKSKLPNMKTLSWGNYGHGEIMFNNPTRYAKKMNELIIK